MNRLPVIAIATSLAAVVATVPAYAKSPAPLSGEARNDSDAQRSQIGALWDTGRHCPAEAASDFMPQRLAQSCTDRLVHMGETGDMPTIEPTSNQAIKPR